MHQSPLLGTGFERWVHLVKEYEHAVSKGNVAHMTIFDKPASFADETKKISAFMAQTLKPLGFKKRRNSFNRRLGNSLVHQLSIFSVGAYSIDHGKFYIHAGCYIPEAELYRKNAIEPKWVPDYLCAIRGHFPENYLSITKVAANLDLIKPHLEKALQALARVDQYNHVTSITLTDRRASPLEPLYFETPQPLVKACILLSQANKKEAARTLESYIEILKAEKNPHLLHIEIVSKWAVEVGLRPSNDS